jgi:hypothetical protein
MRELFRSFYQLTEENREQAWSEGLIILDTSALLNLFRYPLAARDRLLTVLERLEDRLWLPHQVALEYHINKPSVIHDQTTRFRRVREEVGALKTEFKDRIERLQLRRRHALIDAEDLLTKIEAAIDTFQSDLNQIEREQEDRYQEETLQTKIEQLFGKRLGQAPTQKFLEDLYKDGAERYKHKIPPGYQDSGKGDSSKGLPVFSFSGLLFQLRYGDLILWKETLQKTKMDGIRHFILVTDDAKEDWWQIVGGQRIGPRPELLDEAFREGGVEGFLLETSERFMEHAAQILNLEVSEEVIQQISSTKKSEALQASLQEEAGFLEKLEATEGGLQRLSKVAAGIELELGRIRGIMQDGTQRLKTATDIRMQTRFTNETALQINTTAVSFDQRVEEFDEILDSIAPGIEFILDRINQAEAAGEEAPEIKETLRRLFTTIIETAGAAGGYDDILSEMPDATAALRNSIHLLRFGVQHYVRVCRKVQRWLDRLS